MSANILPSGLKNAGAKFTPTIPSVSLIASNCLSVRFLECGQMVCALLCVATNGEDDILAVSQNPFSLR